MADGGLMGGTQGGGSAERTDAPLDLEIQGGEGCVERVEELEAQNAALVARVSELESALSALECGHALERALLDEGVIDLETALALAGPRVAGGEEAGAVAADLARSKPFLFRRAPASAGASASGVAGGGAATLSSLASEARRSGDRRALSRYLRLRRLG